MLKIYGADLSCPANKVRFVANELGLEYEYIHINIKDGDNKTEDFLKLHPAGKVPVIDDDGFVLFESNTICKYLAKKQKSELYPQAIQARYIVDQWVDFISAHIGQAMNRVVFNRMFAPLIGVPVDENSLRDGLNFLNRFLPIMENQLNKQRFVCGEDLSLADICLLSTLDPVELSNMDLTSYSALIEWRDSLKQKEFYTKCYAQYGESYTKLMEAKVKN